MKRALALVLGLLLLAGVANAQEEKTILSQISLRPGAEVSVMWDGDVELDSTKTEGEMNIEMYMATCDVVLAPWLTITPKGGIMHQSFETDQYSGIRRPGIGLMPNPTLGRIEATSEVGYVVGVEAKIDAYTTKDMPIEALDDITLSILGEYLYARTEVDEVDIGGIELDMPIRNDLSMHQYEVGLYVSKPIGIINPYFGVAFSDLTGEYDFELLVANLDEEIDADDHVGIRLGAAVQPMDNVQLAVDVKLIDQASVTGAAKIKF